MNQIETIQLVTPQFKLVRTEFGYNQEEMSSRLGISKKTLVQIEKGRQSASWIQIVVLCSIFQESNILQDVLGGDPLEVIKTVVHQNVVWNRRRTLGGKIWWKKKRVEGGYTLQQNLITGHYRILDSENCKCFSSIDKEYIEYQFEYITKQSREDV